MPPESESPEPKPVTDPQTAPTVGFKPKPRLFVVLLVIFALWLTALIVMNYVT